MPYGVRFSILGRAFKHEMDRQFRARDLTGAQVGVLGELNRLEHSGKEEVNQKDLETAMGLTHPTMTELLGRLEKKGYIVRQPSKRDRRAKVIRSTDLAQALHDEMPSLDGEALAIMTEGLTPEQIVTLTEITDIMLANAKKARDGKEATADD